jgi:hypothetical protein
MMVNEFCTDSAHRKIVPFRQWEMKLLSHSISVNDPPGLADSALNFIQDLILCLQRWLSGYLITLCLYPRALWFEPALCFFGGPLYVLTPPMSFINQIIIFLFFVLFSLLFKVRVPAAALPDRGAKPCSAHFYSFLC